MAEHDWQIPEGFEIGRHDINGRMICNGDLVNVKIKHSLPITGGLVASIPIALSAKRFADFDDQMRRVGVVTQSTDAQLMQLIKTAKDLGATTSFTAVQVAGLMTELGCAGFNADQIEELIRARLLSGAKSISGECSTIKIDASSE